MRETPTDKEVILRVKQGDTEAFSVLIARYQARIRALVAHDVANRDDVYDLVQDIFLEAFRNLHTFDVECDFLPWLRSICRHRVLNYFRATRVHRSAVESLVAEALRQRMQEIDRSSDDSLERIRALRNCVKKLKQKHRTLVHLRYHARVAVKDIARQLGQTAAGTSMHLHRVRAMLSRCIERELAQDNIR